MANTSTLQKSANVSALSLFDEPQVFIYTACPDASKFTSVRFILFNVGGAPSALLDVYADGSATSSISIVNEQTNSTTCVLSGVFKDQFPFTLTLRMSPNSSRHRYEGSSRGHFGRSHECLAVLRNEYVTSISSSFRRWITIICDAITGEPKIEGHPSTTFDSIWHITFDAATNDSLKRIQRRWEYIPKGKRPDWHVFLLNIARMINRHVGIYGMNLAQEMAKREVSYYAKALDVTGISIEDNMKLTIALVLFLSIQK